MRSIRQALASLQYRHRVRRATLPWAELEAEAARQGCSPADIFFDRAGRPPAAAPVDGPQPAHARGRADPPAAEESRTSPAERS